MAQKKIYVAEDSPLHIELLRAALEGREDYAATFFGNGLELYRKVQEEKPDLLVLDIILPGLTGLAISRLLKFHDDYRDIPILVISSISDENSHAQVSQVGADAFFPKPFQVNELLDGIERLLSISSGSKDLPH